MRKTVLLLLTAIALLPCARADYEPFRVTGLMKDVFRGLYDKDIASQLGISVYTVKEHINALFAKLGATNRAEAVAIALRKHLLKI